MNQNYKVVGNKVVFESVYTADLAFRAVDCPKSGGAEYDLGTIIEIGRHLKKRSEKLEAVRSWCQEYERMKREGFILLSKFQPYND